MSFDNQKPHLKDLYVAMTHNQNRYGSSLSIRRRELSPPAPSSLDLKRMQAARSWALKLQDHRIRLKPSLENVKSGVLK